MTRATLTRLAIGGCLTACCACSAAQRPYPARPCGAPAQPQTAAPALPERTVARHPVTLIRGATVWTAQGQILERTDVLLREGKIAAVGRDLPAAGVELTVDGAGKHLTPGLIDPHSHMGVYPVPSLKAHGDGNEVAKPISAEIRARDGLWPQDPAISHALAAGVTIAHVVPGSANLIGGRGVVVKLLPGRSPAELAMSEAPPTLKMACGENPKRVYGNKGGPHTRMGNVARLRVALQQAVEYRRQWRLHREKLARWTRDHRRGCGGPPHASRDDGDRPKGAKRDSDDDQPPAPPKRDLALETLVGVLEGRINVHWHCYRADDMLNALGVAREFGFHVQAFHHAVEAYKIRDALARAGTAAVTWVNWWGFKIEAYDTIGENAPLVASAGALATLHTDSPMVIQRYNQEAALAYFKAQNIGLDFDRDRALRLVTLNAAKVLGIDTVTGSIAPGKMADVVLWSADPFSVYSRPDKVFVDGSLAYDRQAPAGRRRSDFELQTVPRPAPLSAPVAPRPLAISDGWRPAAPRWVAASPPSKASPTLAIVGARVYTMAGKTLERATIVVRDGAIIAVGPSVTPPADATVIDGKGKEVTPGLIAAGSTIGLVEISLESSTADQRPAGKPARDIRAALRVWDALNPSSATVAVTRIEGFTSAVAVPYGGLINGQAAAFDLHGINANDIALHAPVAMYANLGERGAGAAAGSKAMALMRLRQLLRDARRLQTVRRALDARRYRDLSAPVDQLAALAPVIDRRMPLIIRVERAADILGALALAREERILVALSGADEGWRVADAIAAARVPVLLSADRNLPFSFESLGARFDNAARLYAAGVAVAFSAMGEAHHARSLRQMAGLAVANGLPHDAALAALTVVPARIFGLPARGVIAKGARANLVLWSGDPLELGTRVEALLIGGERIPLTSRQTALRERYRTLPPAH